MCGLIIMNLCISLFKLDLLNTKKQEIVYDIFNWSANEESLVSVIAIANTLDLPERLLSQRVSSRLVGCVFFKVM